jgi:putative MATE family efflux protein
LIYATDTALMGRVGTTELAAMSLIDTAIELWIVPVVGLVEAMQIMVARRAGAGDDQGAGSVFKRTLVLMLAVCVVFAVVVKLWGAEVGAALIGSGQVANAVDAFLQIAVFGLVLMAVNLLLVSLHVGLGRARVLLGATLIVVLTNLVFSYVLVLGKLGAPRLGIEGAGYAFVAAEAATLVYVLAHTRRRLNIGRLGLLKRIRPQGATVRPLVKLSSVVGLHALLQAVTWLAFFLLVERLGEAELAWSSLVFAAFSVLLIPGQAFAEAGYTLVSNVLGAGAGERLGELMRRVTASAVLFTAVLAGLCAVFPDVVLSVFTDDSASIDGARETLRLVAAGVVVVVAADVWVGALFGLGDGAAALAIETLASVVTIGGVAVTGLALSLPLTYVWLSVLVASVLSLVIALARFRKAAKALTRG